MKRKILFLTAACLAVMNFSGCFVAEFKAVSKVKDTCMADVEEGTYFRHPLGEVLGAMLRNVRWKGSWGFPTKVVASGMVDGASMGMPGRKLTLRFTFEMGASSAELTECAVLDGNEVLKEGGEDEAYDLLLSINREFERIILGRED